MLVLSGSRLAHLITPQQERMKLDLRRLTKVGEVITQYSSAKVFGDSLCLFGLAPDWSLRIDALSVSDPLLTLRHNSTDISDQGSFHPSRSSVWSRIVEGKTDTSYQCPRSLSSQIPGVESGSRFCQKCPRYLSLDPDYCRRIKPR